MNTQEKIKELEKEIVDKWKKKWVIIGGTKVWWEKLVEETIFKTLKSCEEEEKAKVKKLKEELKDTINSGSCEFWDNAMDYSIGRIDEIFYPKEEPKKAEVGK